MDLQFADKPFGFELSNLSRVTVRPIVLVILYLALHHTIVEIELEFCYMTCTQETWYSVTNIITRGLRQVVKYAYH